MLRVLAALPAAAILSISSFFTAASGSPGWPSLTTAGPFLRTEIRDMTKNRYAKVWTELYPAHRAIVPESIYVACEKKLPFAAPLVGTRVVGVRQAPVHVPGAPGTVPGVAVTLRIAVQAGRDPMAFRHTFHLVPVDGRWTWLLSSQRYALYTGSGCGFKPVA